MCKNRSQIEEALKTLHLHKQLEANIIILIKILQFSKIYFQCFLQHAVYLQLPKYMVFKPTPPHNY